MNPYDRYKAKINKSYEPTYTSENKDAFRQYYYDKETNTYLPCNYN